MSTNQLKSVLDRVLTWPEEEQEELVVELAREIEARRNGDYEATDDELRAIRAAQAAVRRGEVATDEEVAAVFAKYL